MTADKMKAFPILASLMLAASVMVGRGVLAETHDSKRTTTSAVAPLVTGADAVSPYGVCAHLPRHDSDFRNAECRGIASMGASTVRFGVSWRKMQKSPDVPPDFSQLDAIVAEAEAHGLTILPILYWPPKWARPIYEHLGEYGAFIEAVVSRYGEHFPAIETWNEENLKGFWGEDPNPTNYVAVLRTAYEAAKRGNAECTMQNAECTMHNAECRMDGADAPTVYLGGTAGVPLDFIEAIYRNGGGAFFDAMNVHPYNHPYAPEGDLDKKLENLRALMAKYGDAEKPIVITEHGWPTHDASVKGAAIIRAGLAIARPEQKTWRVLYAATAPGIDGGPPREIAAAIEEILPPGSTCEACFGARLRERLADLVALSRSRARPLRAHRPGQRRESTPQATACARRRLVAQSGAAAGGPCLPDRRR